MFDLLLLNQDSDLLSDNLNHLLNLLHFNDELSDDDLFNLFDSQCSNSYSDFSKSDDSDSSNDSNSSDSYGDVSYDVNSDLYNWVSDNNLGDLNGQF